MAQNKKSFEWKMALHAINGVSIRDRLLDVTVVVLGWLGADHNNLRTYTDMYNLLDMNTITFVVSVKDVVAGEFGRKMERRYEELTDELVSWLEEKVDNGRKRFLLVHTFSYTGSFVYGSILNILKGRYELLEKIIGCVVDSGGAPDFDPKVWAAGFTTAMLKKQKFVSSSESGEEKKMNTYESESSFIEGVLMELFEKFFTYSLELKCLKKRLIKVTTTLYDNQPNHPQLYLYSTADTIVKFQKIESFAEHQKKLGRKVTTFNFNSSPHVDHFRTFTDTYQSLIQNFIKDCFAAKGKQSCNLVQCRL